MKKLGLLCLLVAMIISCATTIEAPSKPIVRGATKEAVKIEYVETRTPHFVDPVIETGKTGFLAGDADDPAIWVHPTDPKRSLIFGVDKVDGLWVWDMMGKEITHIDPVGKPGNVDVRCGLTLGGEKVDIMAVNLRKVNFKGGSKIAVYAINPDWTGKDDVVTMLADGTTDNNDIDKGTYGFCLYKDREDGFIYAFESADNTPVCQYRIEDDGTGKGIKINLVRKLAFEGDTCEGMLCDDALGHFYLAEEGKGIHQYYSSPKAPVESFCTFALAEDGYDRDREGISLYAGPGDEGYIIVVDQGSAKDKTASIWRIYERKEGHKLVKTVAPRNSDGEPLWDEDGIESTSTPIPPLFPNGVVFGHDGGKSNHPMYDWRDLAGDDLKIFD